MGFMMKFAVAIPLLAVGLYLLKQYSLGGTCDVDAKLTGKVIIITGANVGLGKVNALDHVQRGARVILACRSMDRGWKAAREILATTGVPEDRVDVMKLDLSSLRSVREFVKEFKKKETRLDILINNAGVMWVPYSETEDGFETTMGVNHFGHFLLTNLLVDMLKTSAPSRVVTVSSRAHMWGTINFDDLRGTKTKPFAAYGNSKLANVLFSKELARRLEGTGVTTYAVHPGYVRTELTRSVGFLDLPVIHQIYKTLTWPFVKDTVRGAQTQICCAVDPALSNTSGKYYSDCAEKAAMYADDETARRLWEESAKLVGLEES